MTSSVERSLNEALQQITQAQDACMATLVDVIDVLARRGELSRDMAHRSLAATAPRRACAQHAKKLMADHAWGAALALGSVGLAVGWVLRHIHGGTRARLKKSASRGR